MAYIIETEKGQVGRFVSIGIVSPTLIYFSFKQELSKVDKVLLFSIGLGTMIECTYAYFETKKQLNRTKEEFDKMKIKDKLLNLGQQTHSYVDEVHLSQIVRLFDIFIFSPLLMGLSMKKKWNRLDRAIVFSMAIISIGYNIYNLIDYYKKKENMYKNRIIKDFTDDISKKHLESINKEISKIKDDFHIRSKQIQLEIEKMLNQEISKISNNETKRDSDNKINKRTKRAKNEPKSVNENELKSVNENELKSVSKSVKEPAKKTKRAKNEPKSESVSASVKKSAKRTKRDKKEPKNVNANEPKSLNEPKNEQEITKDPIIEDAIVIDEIKNKDKN